MNPTLRSTKPGCVAASRHRTGNTHPLVTHAECGARALDRRWVQPQPYPTAGPLADRLDWSLDQLVDALGEARQRPVYPYVVASVERRPDGGFAQFGTSPNFQGGVITLCACKHHMRSGARFRDPEGVWVAGISGAGVGGGGGRHLFYLMLVGLRADSQAEMWERLGPETRDAKSASRHPLGDLYEPLRTGLAGEARYRVDNYRPPCPTMITRQEAGTATSTASTGRDGQSCAGRRPSAELVVVTAGDRPDRVDLPPASAHPCNV